MHFLLYATCIAVKGYTKGVLVDLQHGRIVPVPHLLLDVLERCKAMPLLEVKASFDHEIDEGIDAYINMLIEGHWGFKTEDVELFPDLSLYWDSPCLVNNVMMDVGDYDIEKAMDKVAALASQAMLLRAFESVNTEQIIGWLDRLGTSRIHSVQLMLPWASQAQADELIQMVYSYPRVRSIVLFNAPKTKYLDGPDEMTRGLVLCTEAQLGPESGENYTMQDLHVDMGSFTEAQLHNTGLNRKLAIDIDGNIRNHPQHTKAFGHIDQIGKLGAIASSQEFQRLWAIGHDKVETCKDCEFRYCCIDNDELQQQDGKWYRSTACGYDPYRGVWKEDQVLMRA
jgi:SPASM domain peptide maturase of grasp-with-spasm system